MAEIDQELLTFKEKVEPSLGAMESTISQITDKLSNLTQASNATKDAFANCYNSENKSTILAKFDSINKVYNQISSSLQGDMKAILNSAKTLIAKVDELIALKEQIDADLRISGTKKSYSKGATRAEINEVEAYNKKVDEAEARLKTNQPLFETKKAEAKTLLNKLKGMDASLSFTTSFATSVASSVTETITGRTFEKRYYKASNGYNLEYYIYIPEYGKDVTNLPVHVYLHGSGEAGHGVLRQSLPKMLNKGKDVNGIVICPQSPDGTWSNNKLEDAVVELTNKVVQAYNADPKRVSLSGHSNGAIGGYKVVSRYPDTFSAFVPISGRTKKGVDIWEELSTTKIWAFHGITDRSVEYANAVNIEKNMEKYGNFKLTSFEEGGHGIQNKVYEGKYEYDGKEWDIMDWCFSQVKGTT